MNPVNKTLLSALIISLFSLTAIQGIKIASLSANQQVLGDTTTTSPLPQYLPCSLINKWQQAYCSNIIPTNPIYPTPTNILPSTMPVTPTPSSFSLQLTKSCNSNGTLNFTVSGKLSPNLGYINGVHFLIRDNLTTKTYHQGWQAGGNSPVYVAVSAYGYLTDTTTGTTQLTDSTHGYTIHFIDGPYGSSVNWDSPTLATSTVPVVNCPVAITPNPIPKL